MGFAFKIIISDYLQRTRSYAFLITMAIAVYAAYVFVPTNDAFFQTVSIGKYTGLTNAAWTGYVTAMMSSIYIFIIGFFLVNSSIRKDIDTGVGMIIATTRVSNFRYLLTKACSNFLVLLSIAAATLALSICLFFIRPGHYEFHLLQFIAPYLLITMPALFFVAALAVTAEVFFYRYSSLVNLVFYLLSMTLLVKQPGFAPVFDIFGVRSVTLAMQQEILHLHPGADIHISMGFVHHKVKLGTFLFDGVNWSFLFVLSRFIWISVAFALIALSAPFFHRFDIKPILKKQKKEKDPGFNTIPSAPKEIRLSLLPKIKPAYQIIPLIQTELLLLFRVGPRWLWLLNLGGMIAMIFSPLTLAHQVILPAVWLLQLLRWSDLVTKEKTNRIHYFSYASYKPLTRLLSAQIIAGIALAIFLSLPLVIRYLIGAQFMPALLIILGAIFIVLAAVTLGMVSGGKKLFEILLFLCTSCNINKVPFTDYFGGLAHGQQYTLILFIMIVCLYLISFQWRKQEMKQL